MVRNIFKRGKDLIYGKQASILSAAFIIMLTIAASRVLGLVRNRIFVHFFAPEQIDTYLAAFQLPDLIFEMFILGAMSSAFIPVFTRYLSQKKTKQAWNLAGLTLNVLLLVFAIFAFLIFVFADHLYSGIARGFTPVQISATASYTRILLLSQILFVASYVFTAVLESNQRFLSPAIAPLFYNLGIIGFTAFLAPEFGLFAPVYGAVFGSILHVLVQLPIAFSLGFRPILTLDFKNTGLREVIRLAGPRILELSFFQVKRVVDLFLASLIIGGLTYYKFADSIAVLPTSLFGLSLAKASLPSLSMQGGKRNLAKFKATVGASFRLILFFVLPTSFFIAVLRVPLVRLAFGGTHFDWEDTIQTGYALSAFSIGIFAYSLSLLIARAFYALHDTVTPVKISFLTIIINVALGFILILGLHFPIWALALSYSLAGIVQFFLLFTFLSKRVGGFDGQGIGLHFIKVVFASFASGTVSFFLLKIFDRSAWDKKLSFLGNFALPTTFDRFVLDTRYTINLIILTLFVAAVGLAVYILLAWLLRVKEFFYIINVFKKLSVKRIPWTAKEAAREGEVIIPPHINGS